VSGWFDYAPRGAFGKQAACAFLQLAAHRDVPGLINMRKLEIFVDIHAAKARVKNQSANKPGSMRLDLPPKNLPILASLTRLIGCLDCRLLAGVVLVL
jgi:hypothetical protein